MIVIALYTLLLGAALCFGLSRLLPTRLLGALAAALCLGAAAPALAAAPAGADAVLQPLALGEAAFTLLPWLPLAERGVAAALLLGAAALLLALAGAVAGGVRGFGAIFGWALIAVAATLLSLAAPPFSLAQPLAWAVLAVAGYGALRASGAEGPADTPPPGLTLGLLASALLAAAVAGLAVAGQPPSGAVPGPIFAAGTLAALALAGCPPLLLAREEAVGGPAPLGALIFGLCGPAAALGWLLRTAAAPEALAPGWGVALGLLGALGALACGAGALGERRLRPILAWSAGAQASLAVAAAGLGGPTAALAGQALLSGAMLAAAVCAAAAVSFERATGSDDYTAIGPAPRLAALVWAAGAAASLGLPPLWGFWGRVWLLEAAAAQQPWLAAPILAGLTLLALALAAPLAGLWGRGGAEGARAGWGDWAPAALALLPLVALGAAPGLAWGPWLGAVDGAAGPPVSAEAQALAVIAGVLLAALAALLARAAPAREVRRDTDEEPVRLAPEALGERLRPLAWLAGPRPLIQGAWALLAQASAGLRLVMGVFEQRYYLLGVLAALITIMLLMAQ
jgi:hypothetical protein